MPKYFCTQADSRESPHWFRTRKAARRWLETYGAKEGSNRIWVNRTSYYNFRTGYNSVKITRFIIVEGSLFVEDL